MQQEIKHIVQLFSLSFFFFLQGVESGAGTKREPAPAKTLPSRCFLVRRAAVSIEATYPRDHLVGCHGSAPARPLFPPPTILLDNIAFVWQCLPSSALLHIPHLLLLYSRAWRLARVSHLCSRTSAPKAFLCKLHLQRAIAELMLLEECCHEIHLKATALWHKILSSYSSPNPSAHTITCCKCWFGADCLLVEEQHTALMVPAGCWRGIVCRIFLVSNPRCQSLLGHRVD
ncbi:uncharacterized protein LOC122189684 [Lagopus leucura]|uniref:uncharacterized protein LOC122189684 n=1 Tax=Lagopus leucura TaxID=30410 RepID=UPI001C669A25|nr:uncharacterized protein LOC122189684 [Lagopus leucura]